jgi:hypothetical protein
LSIHTERLGQTWLLELPDGLKTTRKGVGEAFYTNKSPLQPELYAPMWLNIGLCCWSFLTQLCDESLSTFYLFLSALWLDYPDSGWVRNLCVNHAISVPYTLH